MWIIIAFVIGVVVGMAGNELAWTRRRQQDTMEGTPSASHNRQITPLCDDYLPDDKCGRWGGLCNGRHCCFWGHKTA
jgi:hypothetical protein